MQYRSLSNKADDEKTRLFETVSTTMLPSQNGNSNIESTRGVDNVLQKAAETISVAGRRMKKNGASELSEPLTSFDLTSIGTDIERGEALIPTEDEDPYFVFRDDLIRRIASAEETLSDYVNAVERTDTAVNTNDIKERKKRWKRQMKYVESTLRDIQTTVSVVEKNREQFMHSITHEELQRRKTFLNDMQQKVQKIKHEGNSDSIKKKILNVEKECAARRLATSNKQKEPSIMSSLKNHLSSANDEDATVADRRTQAQVLLEQQDETLDQLDVAVERVGVIAGVIHEEISSQNKMLTNLEEDLTDVEEKLGVVMGKLAKLLQTKSKCQLGLILALSVTVVILFFLVLYT